MSKQGQTGEFKELVARRRRLVGWLVADGGRRSLNGHPQYAIKRAELAKVERRLEELEGVH